ncbi:AraC family transcriptional regulator [Agrobacterium fabrum]|uniref:AraC family transcriptional regulator n=1 Tax=Agrobacterium fabrum TaxID=1176649 RepID=UPI00193E980A
MTVRLSDASVDLPIVGSVIEAIVERSYLCLQLDLDAAAQSAAPKSPNTKGMPVGIALNRVTPPLLDTSIRLARLLETPDDIEELAPLTTREILYRLLTGAAELRPTKWRRLTASQPDRPRHPLDRDAFPGGLSD